MPFKISILDSVRDKLLELKRADLRRYKKVRKALDQLANDPKYPSLKSKVISPYPGIDEKVWQSYVENNTPAAYRILWFYGPSANEITILVIKEHD
jgi:hypothetical protein